MVYEKIWYHRWAQSYYMTDCHIILPLADTMFYLWKILITHNEQGSFDSWWMIVSICDDKVRKERSGSSGIGCECALRAALHQPKPETTSSTPSTTTPTLKILGEKSLLKRRGEGPNLVQHFRLLSFVKDHDWCLGRNVGSSLPGWTDLKNRSLVYALLHNRYRWVSDRHDHKTLHSGTQLTGLRDTRPLRVMTSSDVGCNHRRDCRLLNDAWPIDRLYPAPWSGLADDSTLDCTNRPALVTICGQRWQSGASVLWGRDLTCRRLDIWWMLLPNAAAESSIVASVLDVVRFWSCLVYLFGLAFEIFTSPRTERVFTRLFRQLPEYAPRPTFGEASRSSLCSSAGTRQLISIAIRSCLAHCSRISCNRISLSEYSSLHWSAQRFCSRKSLFSTSIVMSLSFFRSSLASSLGPHDFEDDSPETPSNYPAYFASVHWSEDEHYLLNCAFPVACEPYPKTRWSVFVDNFADNVVESSLDMSEIYASLIIVHEKQRHVGGISTSSTTLSPCNARERFVRDSRAVTDSKEGGQSRQMTGINEDSHDSLTSHAPESQTNEIPLFFPPRLIWRHQLHLIWQTSPAEV